jgi:hypothetical protein
VAGDGYVGDTVMPEYFSRSAVAAIVAGALLLSFAAGFVRGVVFIRNQPCYRVCDGFQRLLQ